MHKSVWIQEESEQCVVKLQEMPSKEEEMTNTSVGVHRNEFCALLVGCDIFLPVWMSH